MLFILLTLRFLVKSVQIRQSRINNITNIGERSLTTILLSKTALGIVTLFSKGTPTI